MTTDTKILSDSVQHPLIQTHQAETGTPAASMRGAVIHYLQEYFKKMLENNRVDDLYEKTLSEVEPVLLEMTLQYCHHNQVQAAKQLGISRGTLRQKMRKYGILKNKS